MGTNLRTVGGSLVAVVLATAVAAGCSSDPAPATAPPTTAPAPTTAPTSTTVPTSAPTTAPRTPAQKPTTRSREPLNNSQQSFSCDLASDGVPVCEGKVPASVGKYRTPQQEIERQRKEESEAALRACVAQTGMTRDECIADAKAGNAS